MCTDMKKLQDTLINEQNMVESHILKRGGAHTQKLLYTERIFLERYTRE